MEGQTCSHVPGIHRVP